MYKVSTRYYYYLLSIYSHFPWVMFSPLFLCRCGANRFAKLVNASVRHSMRRLRNTLRSPPTTPSEDTTPSRDPETGPTPPHTSPYIPPPDYVPSPPQYSTLDPLRRQQALAALCTAAAPPPSACVKVDDDTPPHPPHTPPSTSLDRSSSLRRSGLRRSIASGVRRSARRLAASLGMRAGDDGSWLVVGSEGEAAEGRAQPYVYTNMELLSHSHA